MIEIFLDSALKKSEGVDVFSFAIYHDHESGFVSVCIDTKKNSGKKVEDMNAYNMKHFNHIIAEGNLDEATMWQANVGRNLSLGDFEAVNIAELELVDDNADDEF